LRPLVLLTFMIVLWWFSNFLRSAAN
jgi:hypothetical protein